jgi:phage FluMu gp28-like protein
MTPVAWRYDFNQDNWFTDNSERANEIKKQGRPIEALYSEASVASMIADNKAMRGALNVLLLGYKFDDFVEYVNAKKVLQETKK